MCGVWLPSSHPDITLKLVFLGNDQIYIYIIIVIIIVIAIISIIT